MPWVLFLAKFSHLALIVALIMLCPRTGCWLLFLFLGRGRPYCHVSKVFVFFVACVFLTVFFEALSVFQSCRLYAAGGGR